MNPQKLYGSWNSWGNPPFSSHMNWQPSHTNNQPLEIGENFNQHPSLPDLRYPAPQQKYSSQSQNYSHSFRYTPSQRYDSWNYRPRYEYNPVRNTDFRYNRWDDRDDNSIVYKRSTDSRSDSRKNHSLSGSSEKLNLTVTKEIDQKYSNRKCSVSKNSEENKRKEDSKGKNEAEVRYFQRRTRKRESNRLAQPKRAEKRNRDISTLRKLPSSKKLNLVSSTSSRKMKNIAKMKSSKESLCHKDRNDDIDNVAKPTSLNETRISVEKTTDSALAKIGDSCSEIMKELKELINSDPSKLQSNDQKVNNIDVDCSNNSLNLMEMEDDVIMIQPEVPTVDLTDNDVEDISLYRNPETPVPSIKVECDDTTTSPSVDQPMPNLAFNGELQPLNTRLTYLDCFTTIFDYTRPVNMDISPSESFTESINGETDPYDELDVSKQLSFNETVNDQTEATENICDIELLADNQIEKVNENFLSTETEDLIPYVKRNLSRSKSLSYLRENNVSVTKFRSLRDLRTVHVDSNCLVPRIHEKEKSLPVSILSKQDNDDVNMVSNHYTDELYWLLCVSAKCTAGSDAINVKEEDIETEPNDSSLDNSTVHNGSTTTDISMFDKPSPESNSFNEVISSDKKAIGETVMKPVEDIKMKRKFQEDIQRNNNVNQFSKVRKNSEHIDTFKPFKKRKRIKVFDDSSSDDESLKNKTLKKTKENTEQKVKETKVNSETHHDAKLGNSITSHTAIKPISKEELKISKKSSENKSTTTHKIVSRRSSYNFEPKYPTNKNVDLIKRREKIKQLFGDLSDDEEESVTNPDISIKEEKTQRASTLQQFHKKNKDKSKEKNKLLVESNPTSSNPNKVQKESRKSRYSQTSDVKSKSRSTSKERISDIVRTNDSSSSSRRSSISHKKINNKHSFGKVEDHEHTESVAESRNVGKQTTRKLEPVREKYKTKSKGLHSKTALSKGRHLAPDILSVTPEVLLPLCEATAEEHGLIELQSCETFEVVNLQVPVISKIVEDVCTDRGVVAEAPEVKTDYQTVKQVEVTSDDDDVVAVESDALVIDLTEDGSPTKVNGSWSVEDDLQKLLMNSKNKGETITIYKADEGDSNTKGVEAVNILLDCNGKSTMEVTVTDKNPNLDKELQKNTAVSHISKTNLPQSSAASKPSEATLPEVNISRQSASIATQQVLIPNNLSLASNHQNVTSIRQPSDNVTPSQQSTSFQTAVLPNTQKQPPPLFRSTLDLMSYQINQIPIDFRTDTSNEKLSINDRTKIVEILSRHVYFLAHLFQAQKMYMRSLSQCLHYRSYFQTELTLFEDQIKVRLQSQSLRLYRELMDLKIKATKSLNHNVMLIMENLTISLESKDMPKQVTRSTVFLLLWKLLKFKVELYMKIPLFNLLVLYCNTVTKKIKSKFSGEQQHKTSTQDLHVNNSLQPSASSNLANQDYQQSTPPQSKPVSANLSKDQFLSPKPLAFRRLTPSEHSSKHSQATLNAPPVPTGLGNILIPSSKNAQMSLSLTASSVAYTNSSASHNTYQRQSTTTEYNSSASTSFSITTSSDAGSSNRKFPSSTSRFEYSAPAEPTYQPNNCHSSLLLSELLRVRKGETHSSLNKTVMVNLPFTKPQPYIPKSSSVSTNVEPKCRINIIQDYVVTSKKNTTSNVASSAELFKHFRGQASVQTETRPNQLTSSEETSTLNLTGSTTRGTLDHLYVAKSKVDSDGRNMTFNHSQITVPSIPTTEVSDQNTKSCSIQSLSPKPTDRPGILTVSTESNVTLSSSTDAAIDIIDLTWIDDMDETDLQNDMDFIYIKQENLEGEASNPEAQRNRAIDSPTDSGVESPGLQNEEEPTLTYVSRLCPCGLTASYTCACGDAWYCGQTCQLNDWTYHQKICHRVNETAAN